MGLEREVGRIGGPTFFFFFFFCIASRFNEAFLNFSSACRSIDTERGGRGRAGDTVDPASTTEFVNPVLWPVCNAGAKRRSVSIGRYPFAPRSFEVQDLLEIQRESNRYVGIDDDVRIVM